MPRTGLSKEEILNKSIELVNLKGINNLSVTTLSEALGIKKPSLYYHAQTVEDVIQWIMIYGWQKVSTEIVAKANSSDPEKAMKKYARLFYKFAKANPGVFEAMLWYNKYSSDELKNATEGLYNSAHFLKDSFCLNPITLLEILFRWKKALKFHCRF